MRLKGLAPFALWLACTPASAQTPTNVNDCTLLPDPVALRRCVDSFGPGSARVPTLLPMPSGVPDPAKSEASKPDTARSASNPKLVPPPSPGTSSEEWLHGSATTAKPQRSAPNAIHLDE